MRIRSGALAALILVVGLVSLSSSDLGGQTRPDSRVSPALRTPLPQEVLDLLANEISGQIIFNNEVRLAGAPWLRPTAELDGAFFESEAIAALARACKGAEVRIDRFEREGGATFEYVHGAEFWTVTPETKLIARLEADPALAASVPSSLDLTAPLVYIPPLTPEAIKAWTEGGAAADYRGAVALMWSHASRDAAPALDAAGVKGVISFSARDRYFDPDQVVYSRGSYAGQKELTFGFTVSWRQWSELLEDVESGREIKVRCLAESKRHPDRYENVNVRIPGTEPDSPGVIFTAHLLEGYTKRGANDNMSGCVVQLEILRALTGLIADGALPRPRRTIHFLWCNEIGGTYEQIKRTPGWPDRLSVNINMDMVGEALRKNNAVMTMSEAPNHLPSFIDGVLDAVMNYVWRTNDIVYLPDSPRGRPGGQYFPRPLWEKNGSRDAFRYFVHEATGGSDHICFNNPSVGVPGIELFTWPDQWYHADSDTPDKSDPTQLKRIAFIGAAGAWIAANCTDDVLPGALDAVSAFGYGRIGRHELPRATRAIAEADGPGLSRALERALNLAAFAATRETGAVASVSEIHSGSPAARRHLASHRKQWEAYAAALQDQLISYASFRASELGVSVPRPSGLSSEERSWANVTPALHPEVKGREFSLEGSERYKKYMEAHPDAMKTLKIPPAQRRSLLNFVDGRRTAPTIRRWVEAETGTDLAFADAVACLEFLKAVGWIVW